jgi:hypothetical protein
MPSRRDSTNGHGHGESANGDRTASVRLTRKYADMINGVDLRAAKVGDRLKLPVRAAEVLVAEGWAETIRSTAPHESRRRRRQRGR